MPKLVLINENVALIECEYVPPRGESEAVAAQQLETNICARCGYHRDADLRNQEIVNASNGQRNFRLMCFHPSSPYLPEVLKKLKETGNV